MARREQLYSSVREVYVLRSASFIYVTHCAFSFAWLYKNAQRWHPSDNWLQRIRACLMRKQKESPFVHSSSDDHRMARVPLPPATQCSRNSVVFSPKLAMQQQWPSVSKHFLQSFWCFPFSFRLSARNCLVGRQSNLITGADKQTVRQTTNDAA